MADNDIEIKVKIDEGGTLSFFDQFGNKLAATKESAEKAEEGIGGLTGAMGTFAGVVAGGAVLAVAALATRLASAINPIGLFFDAVDRSDAVDDVSSAFERLTAQAGGVADTFTQQLRAATKGAISDFGLMKLANDALTAGLKPDAINTLAAAAKNLGDRFSQDTVQVFDKLAGSIESGRTAALRAYGIFVDSGDVLEAYARSQGKAGDAVKEFIDTLDQQTKIQLTQKAVLEEINKKYGEVAQGGESLKDKLEKLSAAWENVKDAAAKLVEYLPFIGKGLDVLVAGFQQAADAIKTWGTRVDSIVKFATLSIERRFVELARNAQKAISDIPFLGSSPGQVSQLKGLESALSRIDKELLGVATTIIDTKAPTVEIGKALEEVARQSNKVTDATKGAEKAAKDAEKAHKEWLDQAEKDAEDYAKALQKAKEEGRSVVEVLLNPDNIGGEKKSSRFDPGAWLGEQLGFFGQDAEANDAIAGAINTALDSAINSISLALKGGTSAEFKKLGSSMASAIADQFLPGSGPIVGALTDGFLSLFDTTDSAGTTFRKTVDKFFADAFEANRLQVIIDGQLQQIKDLDFGGADFGNAGAGFFDVLKDLPAQAQEAFNGVAIGFDGLLGKGESFATNLAAALANNVGGSLNNLQLLVQASGKSFEELRGQIVDAFLDGKLSFLEAQSALQGIQNIAEDGIPGALGAAGEAFDNLALSTVNGGRASTDAIRDIGAEAKELGLKTIPQLISFLVNTAGKSSSAVQQVMDSLATFGIDSIDEISKATDEQLLPVLANLQANGFDFAEASNSVDELTTQLERLPASKDVQINIKVNTTKEGQEALKNAIAVGGGNASRDLPGAARQ